jgi:hypothetical protein
MTSEFETELAEERLDLAHAVQYREGPQRLLNEARDRCSPNTEKYLQQAVDNATAAADAAQARIAVLEAHLHADPAVQTLVLRMVQGGELDPDAVAAAVAGVMGTVAP